jgi:peptidoglycan-N-acetylglucosamine deacetylase
MAPTLPILQRYWILYKNMACLLLSFALVKILPAMSRYIIGNHSYSHDFWFDMFGSSKMLVDMQQMDGEVIRTTGLKPALFRPPYGVTNPNVKRAVKNGRYIPIGWSIRSLDTMAKDKQKLLSRITGNMKGGDIILLHDSVEMTANMLPELIEEINKKGFKIVALDKMLNITAYV